MISLNNGWLFTPVWSEEFLNGKAEGEKVCIPHTVREVPLHYAGPEYYEGVSGYRRRLELDDSMKGKRLFLRFDGAAHIADVFVNRVHVCAHRCGYTAFETEITDYVNLDGENEIAVRLDSTENSEIPPFGFVIDYLTYGGLYREVWLDVRPACYIEDIFVTTPSEKKLKASITVNGSCEGLKAVTSVYNGESCILPGLEGTEIEAELPEAENWSIANPKLYTIAVELKDAAGNTVHEKRESFGFRTAEFRADGFYLNGEKIFIRGLNRHQSYPYVGYAAPERMQREDARILKEELCCNAVRTSHYPQSKHFVDECDRIGLLVFMEIPGWQHIGNEEWKECAVDNTREMVLQYRNHPSIILWGVRINESQDDDDFYERTNASAHALDSSRATSGVRFLEKSSLLEDVYSYNDFSHNGLTPGCKKKKDVTPDMSKALLITECNGHMFPTKAFDNQSRRQEHALRHARVMDAAMADGEHAGCFEWCMFDYPTHKDFGSGDRVCYHGVLDAFRNHKIAASFYESQGDERPFIDVTSTMDIGDYPAGKLDYPYVFTNADEVELYKNGDFVKTFRPSPEWKGLKHGPIKIDDYIGDLVREKENYSTRKAEWIYKCLRIMEREGATTLSLKGKLMVAWAMLRHGLTFSEGYELYSKYVGNWGGEATVWRFDAKKNGETVASVIRTPSTSLTLEANAGSLSLKEGNTYDMTLVRVRIIDGCGQTAAYAQLPVSFELEGAAEIAGPSASVAEGGMTGCLVRTTGQKGTAKLTVSAPGLESRVLEFEIE